MPNWPSGLDDAKRYVVFYSRTCEHCEAMFLDDLLIPLDAPITAIERGRRAYSRLRMVIGGSS